MVQSLFSVQSIGTVRKGSACRVIVAGQSSALSITTRNKAFFYAFLPQKSLFSHQSKGSFCDAILIITETKMASKHRGTIFPFFELSFSSLKSGKILSKSCVI